MEKQSIQNNSLNLFKLIAALQVMFGHIIEHLEISIPSWINQMLGIFQGVPIFFTLSGFVIWFSIDRSANRGDIQDILENDFGVSIRKCGLLLVSKLLLCASFIVDGMYEIRLCLQ